MVKNTGKAPGAGAIRPLNLPVPVVVKEDESRRPVSVVLRGRRLEIASIEDVWEIDDEWWRPVPVHRLYYRTITTEGTSLTLFRDAAHGAAHAKSGEARHTEGWYCSR
jgi:hypothetical protein